MSNDMLGSLVRALIAVPDKWLGLMKDLAHKLVGEEGAEWFAELTRFLRKQPTWTSQGSAATTPPTHTTPPVKRTLTVWRRIKGGGTTLAKLLEALGSMAGDWAKDMMGKPAFTLSDKPYETELVTLTPRELGFTSTPRTDKLMTKEFCAKWSAENLDGQVIEPCKPEDGPQLRIQYHDQPNGEVVWMAMERITDSGGGPGVFSVGCVGDGGRRLGGYFASAGNWWDLDGRVVFRLRKVQPLDTGK